MIVLIYAPVTLNFPAAAVVVSESEITASSMRKQLFEVRPVRKYHLFNYRHAFVGGIFFYASLNLARLTAGGAVRCCVCFVR